jgi:hypothetical protein
MTVFPDLDIEFKLTTLEVEEHSDRFGTGVEPYIIPLFFKIDGERYQARFSILNSDSAEPAFFDFDLETDPPDDPLIVTPGGSFLSDVTLVAGEEMNISNAALTTTLQPIPLVIDVGGLLNLRAVLELLVAPVVEFTLEGEPVQLLNLTLEGISSLLGVALGLDENLESCPGPVDFDAEGFINEIEATFNTLIPGTVGGVFVGMENDDFDEDDIATIQGTIRREARRLLIDLANSVTLLDPVPDPDSVSPSEDLPLTVLGDLMFRWDPAFWFVAIVGLLWASADELVNVHVQTFDHLALQSGDSDFAALLIGEQNRWRISGTIEVQ